MSTTTRSPAIRNCSRESGKYHANSAAGFARICATFSLRRSVTTVTSAVSPGVDRERRDTEEEEEEEDDEVLKERRSPRERGRMGTSHEEEEGGESDDSGYAGEAEVSQLLSRTESQPCGGLFDGVD